MPQQSERPSARRRVIVIGAGVTGLTVAWSLRQADLDVVVVEAAERVGGQLRSRRLADFDDQLFDLGAESIHLGAPHLSTLVGDLGLRPDLITAEPGVSQLVTARGLRPLPAGVGPAGPTRFLPVLRSGILSSRGLLRASAEPFHTSAVAEDISVGDFVDRRFGKEVTDAFVDPLLGNLHAGDIHRLSLPSVAPTLAAVARRGTSLTLRRRPAASGAPMFASWPEGMQRLSNELAARSSAEILTGTEAIELRREPEGWTVVAMRGDRRIELFAHDIVVASPLAAMARLIAPLAPQAAELLSQTRTADVATIVLAYPHHAGRQLSGNGLLLRTDSGRTLKAATWLSSKWARLTHPEFFFVRASAGRVGSHVLDDLDDGRLIEQIDADLRDLTGMSTELREAKVTRWPAAFPQLEVGHAARIRQVRHALAGTRILLAGAPVDGLGLSATVRSAQTVAAQLLEP